MSGNVMMSGWVGWCIKAALINPLSVKSHLSDHGVEEHLLGGIHPVFAPLTPFGNAGDFTTSGERKGLSWTWLLTGGGHLYSMLGEGVSWSSVVNNAHYHHPFWSKTCSQNYFHKRKNHQRYIHLDNCIKLPSCGPHKHHRYCRKIWNALSCWLLPCWDVVLQARPNQYQWRIAFSNTHREGRVW